MRLFSLFKFQSFVCSFYVLLRGEGSWHSLCFIFVSWSFRERECESSSLDERKKNHHVRFWKMYCASFSFFFSRSLFFGTQKLCCDVKSMKKKRRSAIWESDVKKRRKSRASFFSWVFVLIEESTTLSGIRRYFSWYISLLGFVISVSFFSSSLVVFFLAVTRCSSC